MEKNRISEEQIRKYLKTEWLAGKIICETKIDSTNRYAKELAKQGAENGTLVVAECQESGRGRKGRMWESPKGNAYFSIILTPNISADRIAMMTLVAALSVAKAIEWVYDLAVEIKWPNDILINKKKICGILTESSINQFGVQYLVVGIGINVNQMEFSEEIKDKASSIQLESQKEVSCEQLIGEVMNCMEQQIEQFLTTGDLSKSLNAYNALLINKGKKVRVIEKEEEKIFIAIGIDEYGALIVEDEKGVQQRVISGEVSVRGIYGYV